MAKILTSNLAKLTYVQNVYKTTFLSYSACAVSTGVSSFVISHSNNKTLFIAGIASIVYPFYKIYKFDQVPPKVDTIGEGVYVDNSPIERTHDVYKIMGSIGIFNGPLALAIGSISPTILPIAAGLTIFTTGTTAVAAKYINENNIDLIKYQTPLYVGLWSLIGLSIGNMFIPITSIATECTLGVGLFGALMVYDSNKILKDYDSGKLDTAGHSLNLVLDMVNITQRIAIILAETKK